MAHKTRARQTRVAIHIAALLVVGACSSEPHLLTDPSRPAVRFDFGTEGTAATVCVSNSSPAGNYTFTVTNVTYAAGGSTVAGVSPAVVARGSCFALATRLVPADESNPTADPVTTVSYSYTSNDAVGGAAYSSTACVDDPGIDGSSPCGASVVAHVNFVAGTTATFSFTPVSLLIDALRGTLANLNTPKPPGPKLDDILANATKELVKGHTSKACKELDHFAKELGHEKKISSTDTATLLTKVGEIEAALGC
ncbi:MAG TPA: hypothetical protein VM099_14540 [Gemmatimonadaceae bacterium]|nr:hypothetical protein [Gemmatimonadaceae bacterium]